MRGWVLSFVLALLSCRGATAATPSQLDCRDAMSAAWVAASPMTEARYLAGTAVLADGRVLVSGGQVPGTYTPLFSAEIYDPAADRWTPTAPLNHARTGHTQLRLNDGRVLCIGGGPAEPELFDPTTERWSVLPARSPARIGATVVALPKDRVALVGGYRVLPGWSPTTELIESTTSMDVFDASATAWSSGPDLREIRDTGTGAAAGDGTIVMLGGNHYRPPLIRWELFGDRPGPVSKQTPGIDVLAPGASSWRTIRFPRAHGGGGAAAIGISKHEVLILGGTGETIENDSAFLFDSRRNNLERTASMHVRRSGAIPVEWRPGCILVVGGAGPSEPAEVFARSTRTWHTVPPAPNWGLTDAIRLQDGWVMVLGDYHRPREAHILRTKGP